TTIRCCACRSTTIPSRSRNCGGWWKSRSRHRRARAARVPAARGSTADRKSLLPVARYQLPVTSWPLPVASFRVPVTRCHLPALPLFLFLPGFCLQDARVVGLGRDVHRLHPLRFVLLDERFEQILGRRCLIRE